MVDETNDGPVCRNVAVRAFSQCRNMTCRLRGCANDAVLRMAARTRGVRRAKRSPCMTALTAYIGVRTIDYETGTEVIKRLLG